MPDATIVFNQLLHGSEVKNVTVWNNIPEPWPAAQDFADALRAVWAAGPSTYFANEWSLQSITLVYNNSAPIYGIEIPFTLGPLVGGNPGGKSINQNALLVSTSHVGPPPNRGRIYFGGLFAEGVGDDGRWLAPQLASIQTMVELWAGGIDPGDGDKFLRIGRRFPDGTLQVTNPVDNVFAQPIPATQRRRRLGVGA